MTTNTRHLCLLALAIGLALLIPAVAFSHDWYDPKCCNGMDCQRVKPDHITATAEGWRVQIAPGDHVLSNRSIDITLPYDSPKVRVSMDGDYHACIGPAANTLYCVYIPPQGF